MRAAEIREALRDRRPHAQCDRDGALIRRQRLAAGAGSFSACAIKIERMQFLLSSYHSDTPLHLDFRR